MKTLIITSRQPKNAGGTVKLAVVALSSAALGALAVEAVNANVTSQVQVTSPATIAERVRPKAYADWEAARNQSFGGRMLGSFPRPHTSVSAFRGMDKMQIWDDGSPE
jgi:hypothetical protein